MSQICSKGGGFLALINGVMGGGGGAVYRGVDRQLERIVAIKKIQEERQRPEGLGMPPTRTGQSLHLGIEMAATLAVGGGIGWFLDRWLDTSPWLLIVFLFLGIGAGLSNAFRLARKYGTELERREQIKGGTPPREEDE